MALLRPSFIDNMGWEMARVYGAVTDQILINLAKYFPYWKLGQPVPQSAFEYQAKRPFISRSPRFIIHFALSG